VTAPGPRERLAAWYVTGPLGPLVAGVADWAELFGRYLLTRARTRASARRRP
jgi:hypothetical protein